MEEWEVSVTKETLQQSIMGKLHTELEEEREASATAASEALSMILRLQREKAAAKMEACQYKRMTEEKLQYAQQRLAVLEEVMQEKEIENSILKDEIELYKRMLSSNNISDLDFSNGIISEDLSPREDNPLLEKTGRRHDHVCRTISLPSGIGSNGNSPRLSPLGRTKWKRIGDYTDQLSDKNKEVGDLLQTNHYNYEVSGKMKHDLYPGRNEHRPSRTNSPLCSEASCCSWYSTMTNEAWHQSKLADRNHLYNDSAASLPYQTEEQMSAAECAASLPYQTEEQMSAAECAASGNSHNQTESRRNSFQVACVHDLSEIPESVKYPSGNELHRHFLEQFITETKTSLGMEALLSRENVECVTRYKEYLDRVLTRTNHDRAISSSSTGVSRQPSGLMSTPRKGVMMNHDSVLENSTNGNSILQNDKEMEKNNSDVNDELKLLRDIQEQLSTIESYLKKSMSNKFAQHDESHLGSVIEASGSRSGITISI